MPAHCLRAPVDSALPTPTRQPQRGDLVTWQGRAYRVIRVRPTELWLGEPHAFYDWDEGANPERCTVVEEHIPEVLALQDFLAALNLWDRWPQTTVSCRVLGAEYSATLHHGTAHIRKHGKWVGWGNWCPAAGSISAYAPLDGLSFEGTEAVLSVHETALSEAEA